MEKPKKTNSKKNEASKSEAVLTMERRERVRDAGYWYWGMNDKESSGVSEKEYSWHFVNEKELSKEAAARPDVFLECCFNLFLEMLHNTKGTLGKTDAEVLASSGFSLCANLKFAFYRGCFDDVFSGAIAGAIKAGEKKYKTMSFCEDRNGQPGAPWKLLPPDRQSAGTGGSWRGKRHRNRRPL